MFVASPLAVEGVSLAFGFPLFVGIFLFLFGVGVVALAVVGLLPLPLALSLWWCLFRNFESKGDKALQEFGAVSDLVLLQDLVQILGV